MFAKITKCPYCEKEGKESKLYVPQGGSSTMMMGYSYYDENGIYREIDPNIHTERWSCSEGHSFTTKTCQGKTSFIPPLDEND